MPEDSYRSNERPKLIAGVIRAFTIAAVVGLGSSCPGQQPSATPTTIVSAAPSRSMAFEAIITVGFMGLALYAVCRSSGRN